MFWMVLYSAQFDLLATAIFVEANGVVWSGDLENILDIESKVDFFQSADWVLIGIL